jgi:UDP-N-acetylmuramyl pentapeptide phosphotransferase/UDP-N-acetylglucosamine-1-phosphate transferase
MRSGTLFTAIAVVASAAALSSLLIYFLKPLLIRYLLAHPNARSSHRIATPQGAGVAVIAALLIVLAAAWLLTGRGDVAASLLPVLAAAAALTVLGLADDARALPVWLRFVGQTVAAMVMLFSLPPNLHFFPDLLPLPVERALLVIGTVWFVNAINFLDGIDWITAAQVVPMTLGIAVLAKLGTIPASIGVLALVLLGAMIGFALFNKHPAQVFLGDAGSLPIGLLLAFMLIVVASADKIAAPLLALYTLADSTVTLFRRALDREPLFTAHRRHFYQLAVIRGLTPPQVTTRIFLLGLFLAFLAVVAAKMESDRADLLLFGAGAAATGLLLAILARGRRYQAPAGNKD